MLTRISAILLIAVFLLTYLISCSEPAQKSCYPQATTAATAETSAAETDRSQTADNVPVLNFEGKEFRVI